MNIFDRRDKILAKLHELRESQPAPSVLQDHLGTTEISTEDVADDYGWLHANELITNESRPALTALGVNFVELGRSVKQLAEANVQGAIVQNIQNNTTNGGTGLYSLGDHVTNTQQVKTENDLEEILAILRNANEVEKADELQEEIRQNGVVAAVKKVFAWIASKEISGPVIAEVAPRIMQAMLD